MSERDFSLERDVTLELSIAEAAAGYDFTVRENVEGKGFVLPRIFVITGGGALSFVDANGRARTLHATAGRAYPATIARITGCTGAGFVQLFANASAIRGGAPAAFNHPYLFDFEGNHQAMMGDQVTIYPPAGFLTLPPHPLVVGSGPWGFVLIINVSGTDRAIQTDGAFVFDSPPPYVLPNGARRMFVADNGDGSTANWSVITL